MILFWKFAWLESNTQALIRIFYFSPFHWVIIHFNLVINFNVTFSCITSKLQHRETQLDSPGEFYATLYPHGSWSQSSQNASFLVHTDFPLRANLMFISLFTFKGAVVHISFLLHHPTVTHISLPLCYIDEIYLTILTFLNLFYLTFFCLMLLQTLPLLPVQQTKQCFFGQSCFSFRQHAPNCLSVLLSIQSVKSDHLRFVFVLRTWKCFSLDLVKPGGAKAQAAVMCIKCVLTMFVLNYWLIAVCFSHVRLILCWFIISVAFLHLLLIDIYSRMSFKQLTTSCSEFTLCDPMTNCRALLEKVQTVTSTLASLKAGEVINSHVNLFAFLCSQEEVLSLLCTLRCLYPRGSPCHETEREVWVEETTGAMVAHTCCI